MYDFAELETVYENIVSTEKSLAEFSHYAIYELEGGLSVWSDCKEKILRVIALQKLFLRKIAAESKNFTVEQQQIMKSWNLE